MTSAGPALPPSPPAPRPEDSPDKNHDKKGLRDKGVSYSPKRGNPDFSLDESLPERPSETLKSAAAPSSSRQGWIVLEASEAVGDIYAEAQKHISTNEGKHEEWIELYATSIAEHNFPDNLFSQDLAREWVMHVELNHPFCSRDREDLAHVMGHKVFPEDKRLAEFYTKKLMGDISPKESDELSEAFKKMGR